MNQRERDSIDHVKESINERKRKIRRAKRKRLLKRLFKLFLVALVISGIVLLDQSEISRIRSIRITGNEAIPTKEIEQTLGISIGDRMITNGSKKLDKQLEKLVGLDTSQTTIYYRQGIVNVVIKEKQRVGYLQGETLEVLYEDGTRRNISAETLKTINGLPLFVGFSDEQLAADILSVFGSLNSEILMTISEVHRYPESYDERFLKLVMNNDYFVYSSVGALPLLRSYASIIDRTEPENRCIYLLEYGPTNESQIATAKRCDE